MFFIAIALIIIYIIISQTVQIERFNNGPQYISQQGMQKVVDNTPFFDRMNYYDLKARRASSKERYKHMYMSGIMEFTPDEKAMLAGLVETCEQRVLNKTKRLNSIPWKFCKLDANYENGWPHTLEDVIIIPSDFLSKDTSRNKIIETLIHEKIHVFQRLYQKETTALINSWGFQSVRTPDYVRQLARNNPDLEGFFHFHYMAPVQLYNTQDPTSLSDSDVVVVDITKPTLTTVQGGLSKLAIPNVIHQTEHPYEIMASLIPKIYLSPDNLEKGNHIVSTTIDWCERTL